MMRLTPISTRTDTLVPYTSLFRSGRSRGVVRERVFVRLYKNHNKLLGGHNEIEGKLVPRGVDCDVNGRRRPRLCPRSEENTSELKSLMRISYAVFCLKKKKNNIILLLSSINLVLDHTH